MTQINANCYLCKGEFNARSKVQKFCSHSCRDEYNDDFNRRQSLSNDLRFKIFARDSFCCVYCGSKQDLQIDHLTTVHLGGGHSYDNLVSCCKKCNTGKGQQALDQESFKIIKNRISKKKI